MKNVLYSTVMCAALVGTPAAADGPAQMPVEPPIMPPVFDWSGGYAGLQLGMLNADQNVDVVTPALGLPRRNSLDPDGLVGGLYGGYNWQRGSNLVYGIEAEFNWADADATVTNVLGTVVVGAGTVPFGETINTSIDHTAAIRGRLGYAMDRTLLYATAGWAWIDHSGSYATVVNGVPGIPTTWSDNDSGWTAGVGIEHAFTDRWIGRIDYRYSDFGSVTYAPVGGNILSGDLSTHEIRAGVAMRF